MIWHDVGDAGADEGKLDDEGVGVRSGVDQGPML
jgi:hypothetical protein